MVRVGVESAPAVLLVQTLGAVGDVLKTAERKVGSAMVRATPGRHRVTLRAAKNYDTWELVREP